MLIVRHIQVDLTLEKIRMVAKSRNLFSNFVYLKSCAPLESVRFFALELSFVFFCGQLLNISHPHRLTENGKRTSASEIEHKNTHTRTNTSAHIVQIYKEADTRLSDTHSSHVMALCVYSWHS